MRKEGQKHLIDSGVRKGAEKQGPERVARFPGPPAFCLYPAAPRSGGRCRSGLARVDSLALADYSGPLRLGREAHGQRPPTVRVPESPASYRSSAKLRKSYSAV